MKKLLKIAAILLVAASCTKKDNFVEPVPDEIGVAEANQELMIPESMWDNFLSAEEAKKVENKETTFEFSLAPINVHLKEKNEGILKKPNYIIRLTRGGGYVDLAEYLTGTDGTFFMSLRSPEITEEAKAMKVFFVSRAKKRRLGDEVVGAGCRSYFEITSKYNTEMLDKGIEVNTKNLRHASVLGGTFLVKYTVGKKIFVSQVTFTDSKFPEAQCPPPGDKPEKTSGSTDADASTTDTH
ncbi:MAG: hypothetical protein V4736_06040 [Bdellovibrionota bacterium]